MFHFLLGTCWHFWEKATAVSVIFKCLWPLQPLEVQASVTMTSSSARWMVSAYQMSGSVTAIQTVRMDQMNTTPARLSPADPAISSVPTRCASRQSICVTATTTAGTWVMNRTARPLHLAVQPDSGSAPPTRSALTWTRCAMARGTAPMEQMSRLSAVSLLYIIFKLQQRVFLQNRINWNYSVVYDLKSVMNNQKVIQLHIK